MTVDMFLVRVNGDDELMLSVCKLFRERVSNLQRRLRRDFPGLKTLP